jgi:chorismate mutase
VITCEGGVASSVDARLAQGRATIDELDGVLLAVLAERCAMAGIIGRVKRDAGMPLYDPQREASVVRRAACAARASGLDEEMVRCLYWLVIGLSRHAQHEAAS